MSCVTCHMSHVTCHMSCVTCHNFFFYLNFLLFFGQSGEAYRWRVFYQQGLPRLVYDKKHNLKPFGLLLEQPKKYILIQKYIFVFNILNYILYRLKVKQRNITIGNKHFVGPFKHFNKISLLTSRKIRKITFTQLCYRNGETQEGYNKCNYAQKIPHTGHTNSLDRCG